MLREHPRRKYLIHEYGTAAEALEVLRVDTWRFDCVLLDYHLPDMNALEFVEALRHGGATPVAISVLTGRDDDDVASQVIEAGAEDYILKDAMTPASLARTIENVIERFEIRLQLEAQRAAIEMRNERLERARDELQAKVTELAAATQARDRFVAMM